MLHIRDAESAADLDEIRTLLREYESSLEVKLCFQGFEAELAALPGAYARPSGRLLMATHDELVVGCIGMRATVDGRAEMKRLYVRPMARGLRVGSALIARIIDEAKGAGYRAMVLDTLPSMAKAQELYVARGFRDIPPYTSNPVVGARFLELTFDASAEDAGVASGSTQRTIT